MTIRPDIRGILFDVGDTLLAPYPSFLELFASIMGTLGHPVQPQQVEEALHTVAPSVSEAIAASPDAKWSTSTEKSRKFWRGLYGAMLGHWGIDDADGAIFDVLYRRLTSYDSYRLFPDVLPALMACQDAGLRMGIVSNFEEWLEGMLEEMQVAPFFEVIVISGKEGVEKPDPAIFQLALDRCGLAPEHVAFVGDHPTVDIAAARALGMTGVLVDRWDRYAGHEGLRVRDLGELLAALGI